MFCGQAIGKVLYKCLSMRTLLFSTLYGTHPTPNTSPRTWCTLGALEPARSNESILHLIQHFPMSEPQHCVSPLTAMFSECREWEVLQMLEMMCALLAFLSKQLCCSLFLFNKIIQSSATSIAGLPSSCDVGPGDGGRHAPGLPIILCFTGG